MSSLPIRRPGRKAFIDNPENRRRLIRLYRNERLTVQDIADELGIGKRTVESSIAQLRREAENEESA